MTKNLVVVNAGASDPSSTRMLADRITGRVSEISQTSLSVQTINLREIATEVTAVITAGHTGRSLRRAMDAVTEADGIIAATPVYAATPSGLFSMFFQGLETDSLIGTPVILAATAGTARHALVADDQMRGMFGYLRAITTPTALFAAPEDWADPALSARIDRAAQELVTLMGADIAAKLRQSNANRYQTQFGSANDPGVRLDSELMRLAAGGTLTVAS